MKLLHLCLGDKFADGFNYQVNLLIKYHKEMGFDVEVVASCHGFDQSGKETTDLLPKKYIGECGIQISRIPYKKNIRIYKKLRIFSGLWEELNRVSPDIIFIHNVQFLDVVIVAKYLKNHPNVKAYADNHGDYANSATNWLSMNILHKIIWKHCAHVVAPYLIKIYGVVPARVSFLTEVYKLPEEKCELLVMGADDEVVQAVTTASSIQEVRSRFKVGVDDFLIVTGGKINQYRPETLNLMQAVSSISDAKVKLLIFGNVSDELKEQFHHLLTADNIMYAGWQNARGTYELMAAANLVVFPGLHSVMWEQAVALGVPCVFRDIEGFHHVDLGGNAILLKDVSENSLRKTIQTVVTDHERYENMKACAQKKGMDVFSYKEIARRSIE